MKTMLLVIQAPHGQVQREAWGSISGAETKARVLERIKLLDSRGFPVRTSRTINEAGVRWAMIFLKESAR